MPTHGAAAASSKQRSTLTVLDRIQLWILHLTMTGTSSHCTLLWDHINCYFATGAPAEAWDLNWVPGTATSNSAFLSTVLPSTLVPGVHDTWRIPTNYPVLCFWNCTWSFHRQLSRKTGFHCEFGGQTTLYDNVILFNVQQMKAVWPLESPSNA